MESALSEIDNLLEQNTSAQAKVSGDAQRISSEIEDRFSECISRLTQRAMALKGKLSADTKLQIDGLLQQQKKLDDLRKSFTEKLEEQNALTMQSDIDRKKREFKMEEITKRALDDIDDDVMTLNVPEIVFSLDDESVFEFISSMGSVSGRPGPPILEISAVSSSGAAVRFHSEHEKDAVLYSFRYRRESGDGDDEKESEWKEESLSKDTDEYGLNGLKMA